MPNGMATYIPEPTGGNALLLFCQLSRFALIPN